MVLVDVECICPTCGQSFHYVKECRNGFEAEKKEKWARRNKNICTACYKAALQQEAEERAITMQLPQLVGRSEKQVHFAFSLRNRYIMQNERKIHRAQAELSKINPTRIPVVAKQRDMGEDDCLEEAFDRLGLLKEFICLTESSAQCIIDTLR